MVEISYHMAGTFPRANLSDGISLLNISVELSPLNEPFTAIPENKRAVGSIANIPNFIDTGLVEAHFLDYLQDKATVSFPWSMIDKITPRPDAQVQELLRADGFDDNETIITSRNTYTAPLVNAEEAEYLVIEKDFPNGCPPLDLGGVMFTDRETVDNVERMKVCTCLNPLHTALAIHGCLLDYTLISAEMKDDDLRNLVTQMGYLKAMPVTTAARSSPPPLTLCWQNCSRL